MFDPDSDSVETYGPDGGYVSPLKSQMDLVTP